MEARTVDLLIVGAGLHGLIMAKTYREAHPSARMLVVDEARSLGGSWAKERLYPGLKTNNIFGSYELSDFPMIPERYGVEGTGHIPGRVVYEYLCDVSDHFGITPHLLLNRKVTSTRTQDDGSWMVSFQPMDDQSTSPEVVLAKKLVFATGLTSQPNIPQIPGKEDFGKLILHSKQLKDQAEQLRKSETVVVVGGNKSAWDVCYTAARSGSQVHMIIRPSGGGPSYLWPRVFSIGPFKVSLARLSATRLFTLFDPALYGKRGPLAWARRMMHRTVLGQKLTQWFWRRLDARIRKLNGYHTHPELKKLEPWATPFWMGNSLSIHNYETNWFDLVREGKIHVHITDVTSLSPRCVHLGNGEALETDALVFCTGWTTEVPVNLSCSESLDGALEKDEQRAVDVVSGNAPYLAHLQRRTSNAPPYEAIFSPARPSPISQLYRHMIPSEPELLQGRNIAFIGLAVSIHAVLVAQAQALWITAFFDDKLQQVRAESIDYTAVEDDVRLHRVHGGLRRPHETGGLAGKHADLVFDSLPYVDLLLSDVGMSPKRKNNFWREVVEVYRPGDYRGLVQEWIGMGRLSCKPS